MPEKLSRLAGTSFFLRMAAAGMTYVFVLVLARMMSVPEFGVVSTIMSGALFFSVLGCLGQQLALLRFVPPIIGNGDAPVPVSALSRSLRLALLGNLAIYTVLVASVFVASSLGLVERPWIIAFGLLIVPLTGLIDMQAYMARAYRSIVLAILPKDILWRLLSLIGLLVFYGLTRSQVTLEVALAVLVFFLVSLSIWHSIMMSRFYGLPNVITILKSPPLGPVDQIWKSARLPLWVSSVSGVMFTNLDVVAAGVLIGPEEAALYFVANRVALVPGIFLISYNLVVGPMFSSHFSSRRIPELTQVARAASVQVFIPTLGVVILLGYFAGPVLGLFGEHFAQGESVLRWLLLAAVISSVFGPNDLLLNMCGEERRAMKAAIYGMLFGGIAIVAGGLTGDPETLAMASCFAIVFMRLIVWLMVKNSLGFSADVVTSLRLKFSKAGGS